MKMFWLQAISESSDVGMPPDGGFAGAMNSWVLQMGYPTVKMTINKEDRSKIIVSQERFLLDPNADPDLPSSVFQ